MARLTDSTVLSIRIPKALDKRITREARRRCQTRSEVVRAALEAGFGTNGPDVDAEARRQSLRASRQQSDLEALRFITAIADTTGWHVPK